MHERVDRASTLPELIKDLTDRFGDHELTRESGRTLTYREADRESAEIARGLLAAGVGKGTRVGLLMPNSSDWIVSWLGALRIGAVVSGISTFLKPPELAWLLRFADLDTLLVADGYLRHDYLRTLEQALPSLASRDGRAPLRLPESPYLRSIWLFGKQSPGWIRGREEDLRGLARSESALDASFLEAVESQVTPADLAIVVFTSGSLANPKGVVHTHGTVVKHARAMAAYASCRANERVGVLTPFFWVGGMLTTMLNTMVSGGTLVFPERPDPACVLEMIRREKLDYLNGGTEQLKAIMEHPDFRPEDYHRLRPSRATQARTGLLGPPLGYPLDRVPDSLGMSETFGPHSGELPGTRLPDTRVGSFGRAIGGSEGGIERRIVDPASGVEMSPGEVGELVIRGYTVMQGYYKKERSETFRPDGYFPTGDRCSISEDGHLFFAGRSGEMIKTSGANVSPREVELVLEALPEVAEAVVLGRPDPRLGEIVIALVVTAPGSDFDEAELQRRLGERLSSYKIPKRIRRVESETLPRTFSGKVQKFKLSDEMDALLAGEDV